jgi:hypothetical protein
VRQPGTPLEDIADRGEELRLRRDVEIDDDIGRRQQGGDLVHG